MSLPDPNDSAGAARRTFTANGQPWRMSRHAAAAHYDVTHEHRAFVIENWQLRGLQWDTHRKEWLRVFFAIVPEKGKMVVVVARQDQNHVVTSHTHSEATRRWTRGDVDYFRRKYTDLELGE